MVNQTNSGIKSFFIALLFMACILFLLSISSLSIGSLVCIFFVLAVFILAAFVKSATSIQLIGHQFLIKNESLFNGKEVVFDRIDIRKLIFHGKVGRFDSYYLKFVFKNGDSKKFDLAFDIKTIFALLDNLKSQGIIVEFDN